MRGHLANLLGGNQEYQHRDPDQQDQAQRAATLVVFRDDQHFFYHAQGLAPSPSQIVANCTVIARQPVSPMETRVAVLPLGASLR